MNRPSFRKSPLRIALPMLALLLTLPACGLYRASDNEPLDPARIRQLQPGTTTAAQAVALFGGPTQVVQLGKRSAYRYDHERTKSAGLFLLVLFMGHSDTRADRLWLFFDEQDVLTHFGATLESHHTQYALPWSEIHSAEDRADADEDRPGTPLRQPEEGGEPEDDR